MFCNKDNRQTDLDREINALRQRCADFDNENWRQMTDEEIADAKSFFKMRLILPLLFLILVSIGVLIDVRLTFKIIVYGGSVQWLSVVLLILMILLLLRTLDNKGLGMLLGMRKNTVLITETYITGKQEYRSVGNYFTDYFLYIFLSCENIKKEYCIKVSKAVYKKWKRIL